MVNTRNESIELGNKHLNGKFADSSDEEEANMTEVGPGDDEKGQNNMNINRYATKKTIAQGMLDIALLTANASQLKYVLQVGKERHPFYTLMVTLISISIALQVMSGVLSLSLNMLRDCRLHLPDFLDSAHAMNNLHVAMSFIVVVLNVIISAFDPTFVVAVGICFLFIGSLNINKPKSQRIADILNNLITIQVFIITVINVVISSFGIEHIVLEEEKYLRAEQVKRLSQGVVRRETPPLESGQLHPLLPGPDFNRSTAGRVRFDERDI